MKSPMCYTSFGLAEVKSLYPLTYGEVNDRYTVNVTVEETGLTANFHNIDQSFADNFLGGMNLDEMYDILNDNI